MHFKLGRKQKKEEQKISLCPGVILAEPVTMGKQNAVYDAVIRGVIEFLIVFGGIGGFLSCLEAPFLMPVLACFCVLFALFFSVLYASGKIWVRDAGYIVFFLIFILAIRVFLKHVNSGFYAIINLIFGKASDYFDMPAVREFAEYYTNRSLTITIFAVFLASVCMIVLNIYLSVYMSIWMASIMTIPIFMIPLFFQLEPDSFYLILMFAGLVAVMIMKANGHCVARKERQQFVVKGKQKNLRFDYCKSGKLMGQLVLSAVAFVLIIVSLCNVLYPKEGYAYRYKKSSPKAYIEDHVENLILVGIESLFIRYHNTGGMSAGELGGVAEVVSDYQTDLSIVFAPYTYDTMYLKAYTGKEYLGDMWLDDDSEMFTQPVSGKTKGVMRVYNVGADNRFLYAPYDTDLTDEVMEKYYMADGFPSGEGMEYTYYPYNEARVTSVDDGYLYVPEENQEIIQTFCEEAKLGGTEEEIIAQLAQYFEENIPYTIRPGATPHDEDFVNFFLTENKKGFCVHFASAAVLIFRQMGIPARYVEGYAVPYSTVMEGTLAEMFDYEDFFEGESELGRTAVVGVDINDSLAHAWVEVLIDGKWQVAEVTPPSNEEEIEDFWSIFGDWMSDNMEGEGQAGGMGLAISTDQIKGLWLILFGVIIGGVVLFFGRIVFIKCRRIISYHTNNKSENVVAYYRYLCNYMRAIKPEFCYAGNHLEQIQMMEPDGNVAVQAQLAKQMEQLSYSGMIAEMDLEQIMRLLKGLRKAIRRQTKLITRVYMFGKM